jgi:structural maintenance of chromosomes protein 5
MVNFMTHKDVTFHASAGTNFIIGANGSGKSSLVCAICLGLGGSPSNMQRASDLKDFIRKGSNEAVVQVRGGSGGGTEVARWRAAATIFEPPAAHLRPFASHAPSPAALAQITLQGRPEHGDLVVTRKITMTASGGKSSWSLNNKAVTSDVIQAAMESYAIQMDNKCMFLPQEKISSFTELNSEEVRGGAGQGGAPWLLLSVERCAGVLSEHTRSHTVSRARPTPRAPRPSPRHASPPALRDALRR